jgi:release factor glutamine methyltransferase
MTGELDVLVARLRAAGCVFAEDEAALLIEAADSPASLDAMVRRRIRGQPLEHLLGWVSFAGLSIGVRPGVFVPRRRTELLVDRAVTLARPGDVVVDLCCGSGAIGAAIASRVPGIVLYATDISETSVACAKANVAPYGGTACRGDLFQGLPVSLRGDVTLVVVNAPYVPSGELPLMPPEAREHEPRAALDGGSDGLDVVRRVVAEAPHWLVPDGHLVVESSATQAAAACSACEQAGFSASIVTDDDRGATTVIGRLARSVSHADD